MTVHKLLPLLRNVTRNCLSQPELQKTAYCEVKAHWHITKTTIGAVAHQMANPRPVVHIRNQYDTDEELEEGQPDRLTDLRSQLASISPHSKSLTVDDDTPSDAEWEVLRGHFTGVNDLELDAGFNEDLNNNIPLDWPLTRLSLVGQCGERLSTPWVLEGRIKHLRLHYTCGLRFEGPTNSELMRKYEEKIQRGEAEEIKMDGIRIIDLPSLTYQWMYEKYAQAESQRKEESSKDHSDTPASVTEETHVQSDATAQPQGQIQTHLETLEIIENDAHDCLLRMSMACGDVLDKIKTFYFRATNGCDLHYPQDILIQALPQLLELRTLTLVLGNEYKNPKLLTELYQHLPPDVETLHFRGPASLARSDNWLEWVRAFGDADFHPTLKRLSFVLDLEEKCKWNDSRKEEISESEVAGDRQENKASEDTAHATSALEADEFPAANTSATPASQEPAPVGEPPTTVEAPETESAEFSGSGPPKAYKIAEEDLRFAKRACQQLLSAAEKRGITVEMFSEPELDE